MADLGHSTAVSMRKSMDRRTLLRGAAALAPAAALSFLPESTRASTTDIARRIHALASEMSSLLGVLDGGMWEVRVSPPFRGVPNFSVEPHGIDPQSRLDRGLNSALHALNTVRPGRWLLRADVQAGYVVMNIELDEATKGMAT